MLELNQKSVKRVFIFFLCYLPLQYAMIGIIGVLISEPWPAFALPGFKNVYNTENQTKIVRPYFYAKVNDKSGGYQEIEITEYQLFDGIKESQMQGFIRTHFSEPQSFSSDAREWIQKRVEQVYPEENPIELKVVWREIIHTMKGEQGMIESGDDLKEISIPFTEKG